MKTTTTNPKVPNALNFVTSPLRNRIRLQLNASVTDVWSLIGDLSRFPEYSYGLQRVEPVKDLMGKYTEYICYFKPQEPGGKGISHRAFIKWYETNRGWASLD